MSILLTQPKTPGLFAKKHTGASITGKPATAMAAAREQLAQEMPKIAKALTKIGRHIYKRK